MVVTEQVGADARPSRTGSMRPKPALSDLLAGEAKDFKADLKPYLPQDLIGGSVPHIAGMEEESVWNAASQACGTEKVHYTFAVEGGRVWYLACPSASLASNPDSWCPLAAALPGYSEHWDKETVYLYEQEGLASALRWDPETGRIQVFLGASRTILPRVQSMDANFVTVNPSASDVVPWQNRTLKTEKLSRATARMLIFSGLVVNALAAAILLINIIGVGYISRDLASVKKETDEAALALMENASNVMQSDTIKHMVRIQDLLDTLAASNGFLVRYEVKGKRTEWQAILPEAYVSEFKKKFGDLKTQKEEGDMVRVHGTK
jgi:hypothetical protein